MKLITLKRMVNRSLYEFGLFLKMSCGVPAVCSLCRLKAFIAG